MLITIGGGFLVDAYHADEHVLLLPDHLDEEEEGDECECRDCHHGIDVGQFVGVEVVHELGMAIEVEDG